MTHRSLKENILIREAISQLKRANHPETRCCCRLGFEKQDISPSDHDMNFPIKALHIMKRLYKKILKSKKPSLAICDERVLGDGVGNRVSSFGTQRNSNDGGMNSPQNIYKPEQFIYQARRY